MPSVSEAEGFLPGCGCNGVYGKARRNPSGRLRRPPPFDKGGFSFSQLKRCIVSQAVGAQHVLHNVDVGADVEGVAGKQAVQQVFKRLDQRVHRLHNAVHGLRDILALDALLVKLGFGIVQL